MQQPPWHSLDLNEVWARLASQPAGLSSAAAAQALRVHGPNALPEPARRSALRRWLGQLDNVLIYVLLAAGLITALLGHALDAVVIFAVVLINAQVGFLQEGRAEAALHGIRSLLTREALVLRDGQRQSIAAEQLVPGDVVLVQAGDRVPADLRLIEAYQLLADEAALTGESLPVEKSATPCAPDTALAERRCQLWSGSLLRRGQGLGVVVATGPAAEIGRIGQLVAEAHRLDTPLTLALARFGRQLALATLLLALLTFAVGRLVHGLPADELFIAVVGLAVAAIPEGLPAIVTITLALGVRRMAAQRAIVRRLPAVETLGGVSTICTDKTGTLTRNEMTVRALLTAEGDYQLSGLGYAPHGGLSDAQGRLGMPPVAELIARAALLCNDADLREQDGEWQPVGDPTEAALVVLACKLGLQPAYEREACPRSDVIPFDPEHRLMASLNHDHAGHGHIWLKGAPEQVLPRCERAWQSGGAQPLQLDAWQARANILAGQGMRLLALAMRSTAQRELSFADLDEGFVLLGLVAMQDPPREEARQAVAACQGAGVGIKMITGDRPDTALAIARELGFARNGRVLSGQQLDALPAADWPLAVQETEVFARASPEHKLRIVAALQAGGAAVAMTGDGVNDAPALKQADIGVAMGQKGTEAAREAAGMVLTDDRFDTLVAAVREGRVINDNLKKAIRFILPTNGAEALVLVAAVLLGMQLPISAVQILWINMITAVTLALALAFEPPEADVMQRPPRPASAGLLDGFLLWRVFYVSMLIAAAAMGLFHWELARGMSEAAARNAAVNVLVAGEIAYLFNSRYLRASALGAHVLRGNPAIWWVLAALIPAQLLFSYWGPMNRLFEVAPLDLAAWARIGLLAAGVFIAVECEKALGRYWQAMRS